VNSFGRKKEDIFIRWLVDLRNFSIYALCHFEGKL